ncbi:sugar nucleotide-binding protein [Nocardioides jensenii]|uniref:sugar nucleotide-binding protein n=1 Tax=Nocardioides jensenii TaxID=1843 RepID=UPI00082F46B4|nr:bifunctional dTDP-4-dehydrorhamnose 3,5-epimerase family protein/NAD(P)-dependent oxidoreductase [Nocardioides jensenii]
MADAAALVVEPVEAIPGLLVVRLPVMADSRGWFKENWQREKMVALGLPDFGPVQNNVSFNTVRGTTRGIHTEPWDKFVSVVTGRVFGAWVDMREGASLGARFSIEIDPSVAVFVPRGVGNSYQTLDDATTYSYLVNEHWRPTTAYPALDLADPTVAIGWPIPLSDAEISEKDQHNPRLDAVTPMAPRRTLILGAGGQLGRALAAEFPSAHAVGRAELDITDTAALRAWPWHEYDTVLNAAAHTAVDAAETERADAWAANATGPAVLASIAREHRLTLVHFSSDYVFDGTATSYDEDAALCPLGVYGQSKAAGDLAVATAPRHYLIRTSWVIGAGHNFVATMARLARDGVSPTVVDDQVGRLTFTAELARATRHLLTTRSSYGTYNVTGTGEPTSWADVAARVFELTGRSPEDVSRVSTADYYARNAPTPDSGATIAPRPASGVLSTAKIEATGFTPADALTTLTAHVTTC